MKAPVSQRTRPLMIIAQDPSVRLKGKILRAHVEVPAEEIAPGPWGYRVHVVDYDASTDTFYKPLLNPSFQYGGGDPFDGQSDKELLDNPNFHAQNVYAIVMRTLARFELALGRRVAWGFYGHQIKIAPHAFADANAFYSADDQALLFGYFPGRQGTVFACLSHDIVAHETTHALLDGLRTRYTDPSSPDQAAFHEGFADIVALLSVYALPAVVSTIINLNATEQQARRVARKQLTLAKLRQSMLFGLAEEMGQELTTTRGAALRHSAELPPSASYLKPGNLEFMEPHRRGEVLVAAILNAFLAVWAQRLKSLGEVAPGYLDCGRVVEEGAAVADYLLTMMIRALDYAPPVDLEFGDFLSAVLTSDWIINPSDEKYQFRQILKDTCAGYGIHPKGKLHSECPGSWDPPPAHLNYDRTHFEAMQHDRDEVFRFIWENRKLLGLDEDVYSRVLSVRPCLRIGPDGFALRETVAEYMQILDLEAGELKRQGITAPSDMPADQTIRLYGGGTLIFDEYGRLRYHLHKRLKDADRQSNRLKYLWDYGYFKKGETAFSFANLHRQRATGALSSVKEEW